MSCLGDGMVGHQIRVVRVSGPHSVVFVGSVGGRSSKCHQLKGLEVCNRVHSSLIDSNFDVLELVLIR